MTTARFALIWFALCAACCWYGAAIGAAVFGMLFGNMATRWAREELGDV